MKRHSLELIRWALALLSLAAIVGIWLEPRGNWALPFFFIFVLTGLPAAMLSLLLHPPKFFRSFDRARR